jgi:lipoprotein-anchoring transpeptidase ErfK/SrfK
MMRSPLSQRKGLVALALLTTAAVAGAGAWASVSYAGAAHLGRATPAPHGFTRSSSPRITVDVGNASRVDRFRVRVDGLDVTEHASLAGNQIVVAGVPLPDGAHHVSVSAHSSGIFGGDMHKAWTFSVDTSPPSLMLFTRLSGYVGTSSVTLRGRTDPGALIVAQSGGGTVPATAGSNGAFAVTLKLADGIHPVQIAAIDRAGNRSDRSGELRVDTAAPRIALTVPRLSHSARPLLAGKVSDESRVTTVATLDDRPVTLGRRPAAPLAEGLHRLVVRATDAAGNTRTSVRPILVDSTEQLGGAELIRGARGRDVRELQTTLHSLSLLPEARVTGRYDAATARAVRAFQQSRSLPADGVAGIETIGAMTTRIVIDESSHTLTLYRADRLAAQFGVAVGQPAYPTPTGDFTIIAKVVDPTWVPPDSPWAQGELPIPPGPDNPLGTRWMGLSAPGVGIHGTNDPASIGYSVSHGCIRMAIPDAERLFDMVYVGTRVTITT